MPVFTGVSAFISIVIMAFVAYLTDAHFIFPALGPMAFLVFSQPMNPTAAPRNIVLGHLVAGLCGWGSLHAFGLAAEGSVLTTGVDLPRILAMGLSLGLTSGFLVMLHLEHPPAAATTLMVSLGFARSLAELAILMLAVVLITAQAIVMNRRAGFPYPLWHNSPEGEKSERTRSE